jgi:hypothetical protein
VLHWLPSFVFSVFLLVALFIRIQLFSVIDPFDSIAFITTPVLSPEKLAVLSALAALLPRLLLASSLLFALSEAEWLDGYIGLFQG